jgi:hypothetical protein
MGIKSILFTWCVTIPVCLLPRRELLESTSCAGGLGKRTIELPHFIGEEFSPWHRLTSLLSDV